ncbi:MAG TPA: hypothetical protein VJB06_01055 [archaeon]|nr:hypothetical protein [archaeon]
MVAFKNWIGAKRNREFLGLDKNSTAVDLLKNPIFLSSDLNSYRDVIRSLDPSRGDLSPDNNMWFLQALEPFREDIINSLEVNNLYGAQIARRVHNNYALALLRGDDQGILEKTYWESQPEVLLSGSCGFSGGESVASTYSGIEGKYFNCPRCERKLPYGRGIVVCIYCGLYKGNYQKETGQKCV